MIWSCYSALQVKRATIATLKNKKLKKKNKKEEEEDMERLLEGVFCMFAL